MCIIALCLSCYHNPSSPKHFRGVAMTIPYDIQIADKLTAKECDMIESCITHIFHEINSSLNHWNPKSEVNRLIQSPVNISHHLSRVLQDSKFLYKISHKRFDPSLYYLIKSWKQALDLGTIPSNLPTVQSSIDLISLEKNSLDFYGEIPKFDFDGITKGYTVDLIIETLKKKGFNHIFVNWGGEIKAIGLHDKSRPWKVLIAHPYHKETTQDIVELSDKALATSGDYEQSWAIEDNIFTHIINPLNSQAKQVKKSSIASVSVMHRSCSIADGLATAAMTFDDKKALSEWISDVESQIEGVKFWVFFNE